MITKEQKQIIDREYSNMTTREIATMIGIDYYQVSNYILRMGYKRKPAAVIVKKEKVEKKRRVMDNVYELREIVNKHGRKCRVRVAVY